MTELGWPTNFIHFIHCKLKCAPSEKNIIWEQEERNKTGLSQPQLTPKAKEEDGVRGKRGVKKEAEWKRRRQRKESQ